MVDVQQYLATKAAADSAVPTGVWAGAPALAATGVNMKNTSGYAVTVDVIGGTVTAIAVNKTTTPLTQGVFRLAPGDTIAITYSVAPSVVWNFDTPVPAQAPVGVWAGAPAVAATGVPMVNTSGRPVWVNLSGATLTGGSPYKIDGVAQTGQNSAVARFRLRRGGTISVDYSVAPTMQWVYE